LPAATPTAGKRRQPSPLHIDIVANAVCPPYGSSPSEPRRPSVGEQRQERLRLERMRERDLGAEFTNA
jgi:hypothetical protein